MLIHGDDIAVPYDRFRNRVMFPIQDPKGRVIAFGGRALDPDQPAKYLNSPETPLFHKGHVLFNAHRARPAAHDKERIIVVEGYMDVVTLAEAGFTEAVAPLGTALTEDQLGLLWRITPEPVLCFDGDGAGQRAAFRSVDTALPHLKPGASLMFAFLPDGLDPDDLIRQQGPQAFERALARARPLSDVLFEREWAQGDWSTPERRAGLEQQLRALVSRVEDEAVRNHYRRDLARRLDERWGLPAAHPLGRPPGRALGRKPRPRPPNGRKRCLLAKRNGIQSRPRWQGRFSATRGFRQGGQNGFFERVNPSLALKKSAMRGGERRPPCPIGRRC